MSNLRRPLLEIPSDAAGAAPEVQTFLRELNASLKTIGEQHEASAALRGTVAIAAQTRTDERGHTIAGLAAGGNRIAEAADPVDDQDALTLGYLLKWLTCERLVYDIFEQCNEEPDLIDNALDPDALPTPSPAGYKGATFAWGMKLPEASGGAGALDAANEVWAFLIHWPLDLTVTKLTFQWSFTGTNLKLSLGLYNLAGTLVFNSGVMTSVGSNVDAITFSVPSTFIPRGHYFLAITSDTTGPNLTKRLMFNKPLANLNFTREGKATASTGAALNATLGTITPFTELNQHSCPWVFFE